MKILNRLVLYWLPFLLYALLVLYLSSLSHIPGARLVSDKTAHFFEYLLFAFLLARALSSGVLSSLTYGQLLGIWLVGSVFGAGDEFYQSFIPGRVSSPFDWLADVAGIVGMLTFVLIVKRSSEAKKQIRI